MALTVQQLKELLESCRPEQIIKLTMQFNDYAEFVPFEGDFLDYRNSITLDDELSLAVRTESTDELHFVIPCL